MSAALPDLNAWRISPAGAGGRRQTSGHLDQPAQPGELGLGLGQDARQQGILVFESDHPLATTLVEMPGKIVDRSALSSRRKPVCRQHMFRNTTFGIHFRRPATTGTQPGNPAPARPPYQFVVSNSLFRRRDAHMTWLT